MNNTIDIVDPSSNDFRLHEYYIKYKKHDELGYKRQVINVIQKCGGQNNVL